jgi:hypothetical protein
MNDPIYNGIYSPNEKLASAKLNVMVSDINTHDHSANGEPIPGSALSSLASITAGAGLIPAANLPVASADYRAVMWYIDGTLAAGANQSAKIRVPFSGTISRADAYVVTAPTGATQLTIDIHKGTTDINGTTIWTTQGNRLIFTAAATSKSIGAFDVTAVTTGDIFSMDVDAIGNTIAGSNLTVILTILKS